MTEEKKPRGKAKPDPAAVEEFFAKQAVVEQVEARRIELAQAQVAAEAERALRELRIEFAKAALTGLLAHHGNLNMRDYARAAWQYADFMLDTQDDSTR